MRRTTKLEQWEKIERFMLLLAAVLLICIPIVRFVFSYGGLVQLLLVPLGIWCVWQAFYESRIDENTPASRSEIILASLWLWTRRIVLGITGMFFLLMAMFIVVNIKQNNDLTKSLFVLVITLVLAGFAIWVAIYGGGVHKTFSDDKMYHSKRKKRYKWWI